MNILSPKMLKQVEVNATEQCMNIVYYIVDTLIENGETYGDIPINDPAKFVAFYVDLQQRGVTRTLAVVNPRLAAQWDRKFRRDAAEMMGIR